MARAAWPPHSTDDCSHRRLARLAHPVHKMTGGGGAKRLREPVFVIEVCGPRPVLVSGIESRTASSLRHR